MKKLALIFAVFILLGSFTGSLAYADSDDGWDDWPLEETFEVSGTVWLDLNRDGRRDKDEPGIEGINISFYPADDNSGGGEGKSDSSGNYKTEKVFYEGKYYISFEDVNGDYTKTKTTLDGEGYALPGASAFGAEVAINKENSQVDIGLIKLFVLSGEVYDDLNGNGVRDKDEPPLEAEVVLDWGLNLGINSDTEKNKSDFLFKVDVPKATLTVTPLDASYKTPNGKDSYKEEIDFSSKPEIKGKSYGFSKNSFDPAETPELEETQKPSEPQLPTLPVDSAKQNGSYASDKENKHLGDEKAYRPSADSGMPVYRIAERKNEIAETHKSYISKGKMFIANSKIRYSNERLENTFFTSETAKEARLGRTGDRALLVSLLRETENYFTGWIFINGAQYYCAGEKTIIHGGFKLIDGEYYYFTPAGEALFMFTR